MLERLGVNIRGSTTLRTGNVAAVMVTANLPRSARRARASTSRSPRSATPRACNGGTLLVTPLLAADGNVYAVAQGSLAIAGFQAEGDAAKITRGVPTVGRIANGAIIEREIEFALNRLNQVRLSLRNSDLTTAMRIAAAINDFIGAPTAEPLDSSTVRTGQVAGGGVDRDAHQVIAGAIDQIAVLVGLEVAAPGVAVDPVKHRSVVSEVRRLLHDEEAPAVDRHEGADRGILDVALKGVGRP